MKWYAVRIYFPADSLLPASEYEDEILGESPEDALENARQNWPDAERVELVDYCVD